MSEDLDWQADEEAGWEHGDLQTVPKVSGPRKRFWHIFLISLVALVAGGVLVYWLLNQNLEKRFTSAKLDILAIHNLILYADQQHDVSLITAVLSHENPKWAKVQKELAQKGLLFGRTSFSLYLLNCSGRDRRLRVCALTDTVYVTMDKGWLRPPPVRFVRPARRAPAGGRRWQWVGRLRHRSL